MFPSSVPSARRLAAAALLALPLLGKAAEYRDDDVPGDVRLRAALIGFLERHGAGDIQVTPLSLDAVHVVLAASFPGCAQGIRVMAISQTGDAVALFAEALPPHSEVFFLYRNIVDRALPRWRIFAADSTNLILSRLGGKRNPYGFALIAAAEYPGCRYVRDIPWARLWRS